MMCSPELDTINGVCIEVFKKFGLEGQIYFGRKVNKSKVLLWSAIQCGIGIDTARYKEKAHSIKGSGENLVLTAAVKNEELMQLAIDNQIPIIMDNLHEL